MSPVLRLFGVQNSDVTKKLIWNYTNPTLVTSGIAQFKSPAAGTKGVVLFKDVYVDMPDQIGQGSDFLVKIKVPSSGISVPASSLIYAGLMLDGKRGPICVGARIGPTNVDAGYYNLYAGTEGTWGTAVAHSSGGKILYMKYQIVKTSVSDGSLTPKLGVKITIKYDTTPVTWDVVFTTIDLAPNSHDKNHFGLVLSAGAAEEPYLNLSEVFWTYNADYTFGDL